MEKMTNAYRIAAVGNHSLELGFKLAGITESHVAESAQDSEATILGLMQREDIGIIVLTTGIAAQVKDRRIREAMLSSMKPLFIVVADINDTAVSEDNLRHLIIRALGIDIMKNNKS